MNFTRFFFSSRRRHTRLQGDWSSDVCSSDLCSAVPRCDRVGDGSHAIERSLRAARRERRRRTLPSRRSEERRVGKECRGRWWGGQEKETEGGGMEGAVGDGDGRSWGRRIAAE